MRLEQSGNKAEEKSYVKQAIYSMKLFSRQYKILYWQTLKAYPLPVFAYPSILVINMLPSFVRYLPLNQIIYSITLSFTLGTLISSQINRICRNQSALRMFLISPLIFLIGIVPACTQLLGDVIFANDRHDYPLINVFLYFPIGYYLMMRLIQLIRPATTSFIESGNLIVSKSLQQAISKVIEAEFIQTLSHTWAMFVHGKVLTRLSATALRMEQAKQAGDLIGYEGALRSVQELLENPLDKLNSEVRNCQDEIFNRLEPWEGVVEIKTEISSDLLNLVCPKTKELGEVLEEAISNSVRHGKSQELRIQLIRINENDVQIILEDDSRIELPETQIRFGLGTKLFNLVSDGRWNLSHTENGTLFQLTMSIEEKE